MEVVVDSVTDHQSVDIKLNEACEKSSSVEEDVCEHKSNGVADSVSVAPDSSGGGHNTVVEETTDAGCNLEAVDVVDGVAAEGSELVPDECPAPESTVATENNVDMTTEVVPAESTEEGEEQVPEINKDIENSTESVDASTSELKDCQLHDVQTEEIVESEIIESGNDNVRFETEIVVETNDNDVNEVEVKDSKTETESPSNMLSELGQNIELSEVLRSSDVTENVENNNCPIRQEVFNKEELLDILEGNDVQTTGNQVVNIINNDSMLEAQLALEQITRLKASRKKYVTYKEEKKRMTPQKQSAVKEVSIVNALVKDWDDDEPTDEQHPKAKDSSSSTPGEKHETIKEESTVDSSTGDGPVPDLNKSSDDQPQRRLGRVIKKKVIFDPDNPDTFTKSKTVKNKEPDSDKEQNPTKKPKIEQNSLRANSKSPVSKMQWKKPPPKNSKQNKRLTEVDKLLMDEGAVNMIYQLTPEATKGKKNMKTKAEFIKKLQSSTPEGKEMKFRERKKEKSEEAEAKKILGGKQRSSLSSSVKSPSVSEDFETHSADDSIIYRRHSSSSYSSSCMSPRRLSDVDANQSAINSSQSTKDPAEVSCGASELATDVFQPDSSISNDIINKDDCLSIKKKLNSKLSLALNKRKRESGKTDKPIKKKLFKTDGTNEKVVLDKFKFLSLTFDQRVAEICIRKSGSKYNIEVLREMEEALSYVDTRKDISVTLLTSECGALCSDLDLTSLLEDDIEKRTINAQEMAEAMRSVMLCVERHGKVVCAGVWALCAGVGLALVALSDVSLAGERAAFALRPRRAPAAAACRRVLPAAQIKEMVIFERELSAAEALQSGLVSRVLWPAGVADQIRTIVRDIAAQPSHLLLLKKKLLKLGKTSENTFLSQLENEAALMAEYWTTEEGQEAIRSSTV